MHQTISVRQQLAFGNGPALDPRQEFDRQVANLLSKGYPALAGISEEEFVGLIDPLREHAARLGVSDHAPADGRISFVIVVKSELVSVDDALSAVDFKGRPGIISMHPAQPDDFRPIDAVLIPDAPAYMLADIDRGKDTLNVAPDAALETITARGRSPLTIDEGIAILTQYPEFLKKNNCFSLLASRRGDRRVPALWISEGRPKLGWCWAGNPHTWLGSASCSKRIGA
jgi:hypothetical protein